ncbi:hypothetical protein ACFVIM_27765 [Streptomyces sp. NPDC057638]|uniref:hypothetical protein n=1 Tax=Streptomyces sp. NPDC057638 TaxID=3346190 RepID=UPI0036CC5A76
MSVVALMWEARAAEGRGDELLAWARAQALSPAPRRRESFRAGPDRVLVITWWETAGDGAGADPGADGGPGPLGAPDLPELPEPAPELVTRAVHRWRFASVGLG